jgi:hypothetical protein
MLYRYKKGCLIETVTAQYHERLIYDGDETSMAFCPPLPDNHLRITALSIEEFLKGAATGFRFSTACYRLYVGTWELKEGRFYLVGLEGRYKLEGGEPLLADWFTGVLVIPKGEIIHYVHSGFDSVFEQEIHVKINNGVVTETRTVDNRGKKYDE